MMKIYNLVSYINSDLGQGHETSVNTCLYVCMRERKMLLSVNILNDQNLMEQTLVWWILKISIQKLKSELGENHMLKLHIRNLQLKMVMSPHTHSHQKKHRFFNKNKKEQFFDFIVLQKCKRVPNAVDNKTIARHQFSSKSQNPGST